MKKFLSFISIFTILIGATNAAVRDENATNRQTATQNQTSSTSARTASTKATNGRTTVTSRTATTGQGIISRNNTQNTQTTRTTATTGTTDRNAVTRAATIIPIASSSGRTSSSISRATTTRSSSTPVTSVLSRSATTSASTTARAAIDTVSEAVSGTRTGAEYEQCKSAYFSCMDQFCQLKNDDYRRCSCSNRVFDLDEIRDVMQDANDQLTVFTENLDVVGMTAEQATAMKTASEGENALTADTSASKQLLQAIMNSIRGEDSSVSGKYSDLNSITLAFDTANAFGTADSGQIIATYNGQNLYNTVYPQCREAVRADCTDAQLQRAITAYLMAIEQDCNTVQSAIENQQKEMKSAVRESSALLDLARVENRQNHNSSDMATCLTNVENAILSEEVCGAGYHKCLDNGEFIDVSTGAPIAGVENFYELGNLLKFADGIDAADQKLSKITSNKSFVTNFETRVKKFAEPELDKCVEIADTVWEEYLDKAMLDIYYAQQSKVNEIKQGCFDFVSACYMNGESALTEAMAELTGDASVILQPDKVTLSTEMCRDYINSCNMMFYEETGGQNIITDYIDNRQETDTLTACRAVVKQCFDSFGGGSSYENFYYPYSGLFKTGEALEWFTLYEYDENGNPIKDKPVSRCAQQLKSIESCSSEDMMEKAFGGFDVITASKGIYNSETVYYFDKDGEYKQNGDAGKHRKYGILSSNTTSGISKADGTAGTVSAKILSHHTPRPTGVATEIYNQIVDILTTQCMNLQGRFVELQFIKSGENGLYKESSLCEANFANSIEYGGGTQGSKITENLVELYAIGDGENMCPRDYDINVDTQSWGACLCWENGGRRSKWGKSPKCIAGFPVKLKSGLGSLDGINDAKCNKLKHELFEPSADNIPSTADWCTVSPSVSNQVCPIDGSDQDGVCVTNDSVELINLPEGLGI